MTCDSPSDPALDATATPESFTQERPVYVIGTGPDDPAYLTLRGRERISRADVVLSFESVIEYVRPHISGEILACSYETERAQLEDFSERVTRGVDGAVVMMGDPNFSDHQFLGKIERAVEGAIRILPGISSHQLAASRVRTPVEETTFVTLHESGPIESDLHRLTEDVGDRHLLVLPRPFDRMPGEIAAHLLDHGAEPTLETFVFERLTHDDTTVTRSTLRDVANSALSDEAEDTPFSDLSILVVKRTVA